MSDKHVSDTTLQHILMTMRALAFDMDEINKRITRIETRQAKHMQEMGINPQRTTTNNPHVGKVPPKEIPDDRR